MTDQELIQIATDFRAGILGDKPSARMCFAICSPLAGLLEFHGVEVELVEVDLSETNHVWLRLADGRALDPTADQFGADLPPVYLGPPAWFHAGAQSSPRGTQLLPSGSDLLAAALEWLRAPKGREQQSARRRFNRRLNKYSSDPLERLRLHMDAVGLARAVINGDVEIGATGRVVYTTQGAQMVERGRT